MIEYKGYTGVFEYDEDVEAFVGHVVGTRDVITFVGSSVGELRDELKNSVEVYLEMCREDGTDPDKPYSGNFRLRTNPELHRRIAVAASSTGRSMNEWINEALERATRS